MKITILVTNDDGQVLATREALNWESALEAFGKLERTFKEVDENSTEREKGNLIAGDEVDVMRAVASCRKCGDEIKGEENSRCGRCSN